MFYAALYAIVILLIIAVLYGIYKLIWYIFKLAALGHTMKKLRKKGYKVIRLRNVPACVFGTHGATDYRVITPSAVYEISVITFISNHSRWNIEKKQVSEDKKYRYHIDVRRYNKMFYKVYRHAERPDHAIDFRRESRIVRAPLVLPPRDENMRPQDRQILLFYPKPQDLTQTEHGLELLYVGCKLDNFEVMYLDSLLSEFEKTNS